MHRVMLILASLAITACKNDQGFQAERRELSTSLATFDADMVAVGDRETMPIILLSTGQGAVTVFDVFVDDETHWDVKQSWKTDDVIGEDGINDSMIVPEGSKEEPSYATIEVIFKPEAAEQYRTVLTIISNDTEVAERTEDDLGIWRVVLRGIGDYPCAQLYPSHLDYGSRPAGGYYSDTVIIQNCGNVTLTVSDFDVLGSTSFFVDTLAPVTVLQNSFEEIELAFIPGSVNPEDATVEFDLNDPYFDDYVTLVGNDCDDSVDPGWDGDNDGWFSCGGDCEDDNGSVSPSDVENVTNGEDDDCDGSTDESANPVSQDNDGDGYSENEGDCDDANSDIHPGATETLNQIDDDCDRRVDEGTEWYDDDGDGFSERQGDCDDADAFIYPGAEERKNEYDDDCDEQVDEGTLYFDDDGDGYVDLTDGTSEADCDDADPWSFPGAVEDCDDVDNDCDGLFDEGEEDEDNGACAFLVDRTAVPAPKQGCSTATAPRGLWLLLAPLLLLRRRRG